MQRAESSDDPTLVLRVEDANGDVHEPYLVDGLTLGCLESNDIRLTGDLVKRVHARVETSPGRAPILKCVDPGARILVDGRPKTEVILRPGTIFSIGEANFCVFDS